MTQGFRFATFELEGELQTAGRFPVGTGFQGQNKDSQRWNRVCVVSELSASGVQGWPEEAEGRVERPGWRCYGRGTRTGRSLRMFGLGDRNVPSPLADADVTSLIGRCRGVGSFRRGFAGRCPSRRAGIARVRRSWSDCGGDSGRLGCGGR